MQQFGGQNGQTFGFVPKDLSAEFVSDKEYYTVSKLIRYCFYFQVCYYVKSYVKYVWTDVN